MLSNIFPDNGGDIKVTEDITEGLENAPDALIGLLNGDNFGKANGARHR